MGSRCAVYVKLEQVDTSNLFSHLGLGFSTSDERSTAENVDLSEDQGDAGTNWHIPGLDTCILIRELVFDACKVVNRNVGQITNGRALPVWQEVFMVVVEAGVVEELVGK
eukprot:1568025-Pyramimonas_sp.AAC.1